MKPSSTPPATFDDRPYADRLAALRWPGGFRCDDCGSHAHYRLARRPRVFECARCGHQQSVTAGTAMHRSRVPLAFWFTAAERMLRPEGVSAAELGRHLGVTYETAWQLLHKLRAALPSDPTRMIIGIVEVTIQPIQMRPPRGVRGYGPTSAAGWTSVLVGAGIEGIFLAQPSSSPRRYCLAPEVRTRASGPIVAPNNIARRLVGLDHVVGHPAAAIRAHRHLRRLLHGTHRSVSRRWLTRYLNEFGFRVNRATGPDDVVQHALMSPWCPFTSEGRMALAA